MNYREQQELRHRAQGLGRSDLAAALDKTAEELDELVDQRRYAQHDRQAACDAVDAKTAELEVIQRQIRAIGEAAISELEKS